MKLQLLCLGLILLCTQGEGNNVVTNNIDPKKISGNWYTVQLASDKRETLEEGGSMRGFLESVEPLEDSALSFKFWTYANGECQDEVLIADKRGDGEYTFEYDGTNTVRIAETDYDSYMILYMKNFKNGEKLQLLELDGREPDVSAEVKKRFEHLSKKYGIDKENIIDLTKADRCLQARGEK
ncbi:major urinary protein 20-like [Cavia porcellus]|nr:major urinary protein 20-like [Cavia porcellus]